jgi:hypothetical protein
LTGPIGPKESIMANRLEERLQAITEMASRDLDAAAALADGLVEEVNERLGHLCILPLAPAFATYRREEEDAEGEPFVMEELLNLAYGCGYGYASEVHVVASYARYDDPEGKPDDFEFLNTEYVPWSSHGPQEKMKAIATLPALLDEVAEEMDEDLADARRDVADARREAEAIRDLIGAAAG